MTHRHTAHTKTRSRSLPRTHTCARGAHAHTRRATKRGRATGTNLRSWSSSGTGSWGKLPDEVPEAGWLLAPCESVVLEAAFLGKGLREMVIRRSGSGAVYQYVWRHSSRTPVLHPSKDHQPSRLHIPILTIFLLRSFFSPLPWAVCTDVKCCSFFSGVKNVVSYFQLPPKCFRLFYSHFHKFLLVISWFMPLLKEMTLCGHREGGSVYH